MSVKEKKGKNTYIFKKKQKIFKMLKWKMLKSLKKTKKIFKMLKSECNGKTLGNWNKASYIFRHS